MMYATLNIAPPERAMVMHINKTFITHAHQEEIIDSMH